MSRLTVSLALVAEKSLYGKALFENQLGPTFTVTRTCSSEMQDEKSGAEETITSSPRRSPVTSTAPFGHANLTTAIDEPAEEAEKPL